MARERHRDRQTGRNPRGGGTEGAHRRQKHLGGARNLVGSVSTWLFFWSAALLMFSVLQLRAQNGGQLSLRFGLPEHARGEDIGDYSHRLDRLSLEIFSAPKPFIGLDKANNERAIRSWLRLNPKPRITLLGWEEGYDEAAAKFGLSIERRVDKNFMGVPLFNSMIHRANNSNAMVSVLINGDILLFDDFAQTLRKVVSNFADFLVVGARYDVEQLPTDIPEDDSNYNRKVREYVLSTGTLHTYGGMDVWAWNSDGPRLFDPNMPHFIFGRGKYDNWLTHETIAAGRRQVIDVSETCLSVHVIHNYTHVSGSESRTTRSLLNFWSDGKKSKFELFINIFLSLNVGSYTNQMGNVLFAPWKLSLCLEPTGMCLLKRKRPGICNCEYSSFVSRTQTDPVVKNGSRVIRCGMVSVETKENFNIPVELPPGSSEPPAFGLPLTMETVIDKVIVNNTIILSALNFGYRNIMMNWVCNLRHLGITNFVIAALDPELYRFSYVRGLPVYYESTIFDDTHKGLVADAAYGTDAFKLLTKMKSRVVVRLLKHGYNVVWSDCDIIWFKNPLRHLWNIPADLVIQTNAPDTDEMNARRRINSGFYLAKANQPTINAFEEIIRYASHSRMSEQPCFYDVMCGKNGENREGNARCRYNGMSLQLLDRHLFPNGVTDNIWDTMPGKIPNKFPNLYILHNNWVEGQGGKQKRFERHGFILFDRTSELCMYPETW